MRRWAKRIATRRIAWTDQRIRVRSDEPWSLFLGAAGCSRGGAPRPSGRRPASPARHADASHARSGSRCEPAPARFWRSRTLGFGGLERSVLAVSNARFWRSRTLGFGGLERILDGPAPPLDAHKCLDRCPGRAPSREEGELPVGQA